MENSDDHQWVRRATCVYSHYFGKSAPAHSSFFLLYVPLREFLPADERLISILTNLFRVHIHLLLFFNLFKESPPFDLSTQIRLLCVLRIRLW